MTSRLHDAALRTEGAPTRGGSSSSDVVAIRANGRSDLEACSEPVAMRPPNRRLGDSFGGWAAAAPTKLRNDDVFGGRDDGMRQPGLAL